MHKGPIEGMTFVCPECKAFYCAKCYYAVKEIENSCWSCGKPLDPTKPVKLIKEKMEIEGKYKKKATKGIIEQKPGPSESNSKDQ
ncbi:MAG: hypothetical protein ACFFAO_08200 [Candidatus Hermodarchaeota archaeon]